MAAPQQSSIHCPQAAFCNPKSEIERSLFPSLSSVKFRLMSSIAENLERVRERITGAAARSARKASEVELVAVSKTHETEKVRQAIGAGQNLFGESRVQEARIKIPELPSSVRWHFVGH
ncbi:MAG TPA: hypothetical protein VJ721_08450, partial [Chthoniobacterales bacterium]|nr:hypothetical protein [Chthoniobacterales bacterium]